MTNKIKQHVRELRDALILTGHNYDIWWLLKDKETRKKLVAPLTIYYPNFFETSLHAHFVAMVVGCYRVFEPRRDTINISNLMHLIENEGLVARNDILRVEAEIKELKQVWRKIYILRNEMFAHRSKVSPKNEIWKKADLRPNNLKWFIENSKQLLNTINQVRFNMDIPFNSVNWQVSEAAKDLLQDLNRMVRDGP
jgi:hypothetical protein